MKKLPYTKVAFKDLSDIQGYLLLTHPLGVTKQNESAWIAYRGLLYESKADLKNNDSSYRKLIELPIDYSRGIPCYSLFHQGTCIAKPSTINRFFSGNPFKRLSIQIEDPDKSQLTTIDQLFPDNKTLRDVNLPAVVFEEGFSIKTGSDKPSKIVFYSYELLRSIILTHSEICKMVFSDSFLENKVANRTLHLQIKKDYEKGIYSMPFIVVKQQYLLNYTAVKDTLMLLLFDERAQKEVIGLYKNINTYRMKKILFKREELQNYPIIDYPLSSKAHFNLIGKTIQQNHETYFLVHQITGITGGWPYDFYGVVSEHNVTYTGSNQIDLPIEGFKAKRNMPEKDKDNDDKQQDEDKEENDENDKKTPPLDPQAKAPKDTNPVQIEDEYIFKDKPRSKPVLKPTQKPAETRRKFEDPTDIDTLTLNTVSGQGDKGAKEATTSQQTGHGLSAQERKRMDDLIEILKKLETKKNIPYSFRLIPPIGKEKFDEENAFSYKELHYSKFAPDNSWAEGADGKGRPVLVVELDISFYATSSHSAKAYLIDSVNYSQEATRTLLLSKTNQKEIETSSLQRFLQDASLENCVWEVFFEGKKKKKEYTYHEDFLHHKFNKKEKGSDQDYQAAWVEKIVKAIEKFVKIAN